MEIKLTDLVLLRHGETRVFEFPGSHGNKQGFVIRFGEEFFAYVNQCQHWPVPLDLGDKDFFHEDIDRIRCKTHGAVYHPKTGLCEAGPCTNARLESLALVFQGNNAVVTTPDLPVKL